MSCWPILSMSDGGGSSWTRDGDVLQVIHAGAFEMLVGRGQRADEMECDSGGGAETGDIAGILRDLWFDEDDF